MLFSHRVFDYAANPVTQPGGATLTFVNLSSSALLPAGSQVGDICVYTQVRTVTSQGLGPIGWTLILSQVIGEVGYVAMWARALTSADITQGFVSGAGTNINRKWVAGFRPSTPATGVQLERVTSYTGNSTSMEPITMTGSFTAPAAVLAYAVNLGDSVTVPITITNGDAVTQYSPGFGHTLAIDLATTGTARTTNSARLNSANNYVEVLFAVRGT